MIRVQINDGILEGEVVQNEYGGTYCSFKGIPYAQPPVGDLRFKAPQPVESWTGIRNAKQFGPVCYQHNDVNPNIDKMSEDCLYLNVYTPDTTPNTLFPVMFWIHGGGFTWGSGNDDFYGPQFLVRHGVILVTINYRLEVLGFLSLHTSDCPGNAGMKDQVAALRWVKNNIANFGGNPENITIFGESAGAASVGYHLISPMTKGLFKRAIVQSGATTCWWSQDFATMEKATLLAKKLGFDSQDPKELCDFFKKQPLKSLVNLNLKVLRSQKSYEIYFGIVQEKDFGQEKYFYGDIISLLREGIHEGVEIMTGYTQDEGLMALVVGNSLDQAMIEAKAFNDFFVPRYIQMKCNIEDQMIVDKEMRKFYSPDKKINPKDLVKFLGMDMFVYGVMLSAKLYSMKNKTFLYKLTNFSKRNFVGHIFGLTNIIQNEKIVCHADDLPYLFPVKIWKESVYVKSEEFELINKITTLWTNFAKYGNPTPDESLGVNWQPYTLEKQQYLEIGNKLNMDSTPDKEEINFWETIIRQYLPEYSV